MADQKKSQYPLELPVLTDGISYIADISTIPRDVLTTWNDIKNLIENNLIIDGGTF